MTDWAAEAVTRGDLYMAALILAIHSWVMCRHLAFAINSGRDTESRWVLEGISTILAQIRDRLPKDKDVRIACSKCGTVDSDMMHAECSTCWHDRT